VREKESNIVTGKHPLVHLAILDAKPERQFKVTKMIRLRHRAFPDQVLGDGPHQMLRSQLLTGDPGQNIPYSEVVLKALQFLSS
jgi:hypothetical protein